MAKNNSIISTILLLFISLHHHNHHCHVDAAATARTNNNNPFLKEIMMGRCYEQQQQQQNPTTTATSSCEDIVSSFMNVLESHSESDSAMLLENEFNKAFIIEKEKEQEQAPNSLFAPSSSSSSLKSSSSSASASASEATPMIWMEFFGTNQNSETIDAVKNMLLLSNNNGGGGYVTPETTFGGRLLDGITFCAQNSNSLSSEFDGYDGCSKENSNAYWSFWKAAYKSFTSQIIKGGSSKLVLVIEDPFVDEQFLHDNVLMHLKNTSPGNVNVDNDQERGGAVTHIDIWGVDCNSSIVIKIMKFLYKNNDESTSANHENENNSSNNMFVTTACHGPDLIELGLCYNNAKNKNDRDDNANDESNSNNKACDQYKRGKYTRRGDGGEKYDNDDENDNEKSYKNHIKTNDVNDDRIISSNTTIKTTLSPKKSNTHTGPEATVNDSTTINNNKEQKKSKKYYLGFFFPSLVLLIGIYYRHRYGYIIESYYYSRIGVNDSDYIDGDGDSDRGSSSKSGSSGGNISGNSVSSAYSNYSSFVNPFIAGGSSSDNNSSRSNGSSSEQEIGKRSNNSNNNSTNNNNNTNTNNNIAEGEGEQLLSLPYHCVSH